MKNRILGAIEHPDCGTETCDAIRHIFLPMSRHRSLPCAKISEIAGHSMRGGGQVVPDRRELDTIPRGPTGSDLPSTKAHRHPGVEGNSHWYHSLKSQRGIRL